MEDGPTDPSARTKWAENRTEWAEDRTVLANERTCAGWLRTAMASVVVALGLHAVFGEVSPTWVPKIVATIFIGAACVIIVSALWRARRTARRMEVHDANAQGTWSMIVMGSLLLLGAIGTGAVLWLL